MNESFILFSTRTIVNEKQFKNKRFPFTAHNIIRKKMQVVRSNMLYMRYNLDC